MKKNVTFIAVATFMLTALFTDNAFAQTVSSGADDGSDGTLRQEIADTPPGGTITFLPTVTTVTLNSELTINKDLTISGGIAGVGTTTIDANSSGRVFTITGGTVVLNNLVMTNGIAADGGAVFIANASVTIQDSFVQNSIANGASGSGGGIYLDTGGTLTINNSTISGNLANRAGGGIEDNSNAGLSITLTNVVFDNNNAGVAPAMAAPGNGGALHVSGSGDISITGGSVTNNTAALEGGGLWNGGGTMTLDGVLIDGNTASGDAADNGGGGVFNNGGTLQVINGTIISNNFANGVSGSGGGILSTAGNVSITGSELSGNAANRAGGAIEMIDGNLTVTNSKISANDVAGLAGTANPGNGGALHVSGMSSTIVFSKCLILNNLVANEGGGLWNQAGTVMQIEKTTIDGNSTNVGGEGGGIFNNGGTLGIITSTISANTAVSGSGGGLYNDSGTVSLTRSTVSGNTAENGGGGILNNDLMSLNAVTVTLNTAAAGMGGGIMSNGSTTIKNTIVAGNSAQTNPDVSGTFISSGYNLIGDDTAGTFPETATDIEGATPLLGPLQDNGGDTFTHEMLAGSPGLDAGDPTDTFFDQRNYTLVGTRDMGAYERGGVLGADDFKDAEPSIAVYPNPSSGTFTIEIPPNSYGNSGLMVYSLDGRLVKENLLQPGKNKIDLSGMPSGIYILNVQSQKSTSTRKLVLRP